MFRKNTAGQFIHFQGVDVTTGGIKSGVTWTVRRCIDGTFAAATGTVTEDSTNGWYKLALSQADTNGNDIGFNFTGTGAVPQTVNIVTTAADPTDAVRFGLTALPNAAAEAAGGLYTRGAGAGQIGQAVNGQADVNVVDWKGATAPAMTGDAYARLGAPAGASVSADMAAVKSDTGTILTDVNTGAGAIYTRIGAPAGASIAADVAAVKVDTAAVKVQTDKLTFTVSNQVDANTLSMASTLRAGIRKNTALAAFEFLMTDSTNHNPATGLTVTVTRSIDGGAFAAGTLSAVTPVAVGIYAVDFGAGDLNGNVITLRATAALSDDTFVTIKTSP